MSKRHSIQIVKGVKVKKTIKQTSDIVTHQEVKNSEANQLKQSIEENQQEIRIGKIRGKGKVAIIGVVLIIIIYLILKYI